MAKRKLSLSAIRRTAATLPDVEEGTSYGTPAWRHRGKLLARLHQDGQSIVLKVGSETRDHLLRPIRRRSSSPITTSAIRWCWRDSTG